jgi:hypothetical protein
MDRRGTACNVAKIKMEGIWNMRGRKPTPTHLKVVTNNPGRRPFVSAEPVVGGEPLGNPPHGLTPVAKALWLEIAAQLPPQVATRCDRVVFETLIRLVARMRENSEALTPSLAAQIRGCLGELGLTPSARTRLGTPAAVRPRDPAEDYFTGC